MDCEVYEDEEIERRHAAALVLQNELYWRPLERMERMLQREENMAARVITNAFYDWFMYKRRAREEKEQKEARADWFP